MILKCISCRKDIATVGVIMEYLYNPINVEEKRQSVKLTSLTFLERFSDLCTQGVGYDGEKGEKSTPCLMLVCVCVHM